MAKSLNQESHIVAQEIQSRPVQYLVLSGGGAKGVLYSGVYEAIEASGTKNTLKGIAGSSAGAISAGLIATGMNADNFKELTSKLDMPKLLGKGIGPIRKDGEPLLNLLRASFRDNFQQFLVNKTDPDLQNLANKRIAEVQKEQAITESNLKSEIAKLEQCRNDIVILKGSMESSSKAEKKQKTDQLKNLQADEIALTHSVNSLGYHKTDLELDLGKLQSISKGNDKEMEELRQLREKCNNTDPDDEKPILFKDLKLMNLLAPDKFKELHVTAVNKQSGKLTMFNAKNSPNVEIALACKASASIPIVVKPTQIGDDRYVDGGYKDNVPFRAFKKAQSKSLEGSEVNKIMDARSKGETLAFAFENSTSKMAAYNGGKNLYEPGKIVKFLMDVILKRLARVGGKWNYTDHERATAENIRDNSSNTVLLSPKGVSTLDFKKAQEKQEYLHVTGFIQTMEHFSHFKEDSTNPHPNLIFKSSMLKIYDNIDKAQSQSFWQSKIHGTGSKKAMLLDFSYPKPWTQSPQDMVKEYVMIASLSTSTKSGAIDEKSVDAMLKVLNSKKTPDIVKNQFVEAIYGKSVNAVCKEKRKSHTKDIILSKDDIRAFVSNNPELSQKCAAQMHKDTKMQTR